MGLSGEGFSSGARSREIACNHPWQARHSSIPPPPHNSVRAAVRGEDPLKTRRCGGEQRQRDKNRVQSAPQQAQISHPFVGPASASDLDGSFISSESSSTVGTLFDDAIAQ